MALGAARRIQAQLNFLRTFTTYRHDSLDALQARRLRKPLKHWLSEGNKLLIYVMVRAAEGLDVRALPARVARTRLLHMALYLDYEEVQRVLEEKARSQRGMALILKSIQPDPPKKRKKKP